MSKHPRRAIDEIFEGAKRAAGRSGSAEPFTFDSPIEFEIRYKRLESAQAAARGYKKGERLDPYTVRHRFERITDYY